MLDTRARLFSVVRVKAYAAFVVLALVALIFALVYVFGPVTMDHRASLILEHGFFACFLVAMFELAARLH